MTHDYKAYHDYTWLQGAEWLAVSQNYNSVSLVPWTVKVSSKKKISREKTHFTDLIPDWLARLENRLGFSFGKEMIERIELDADVGRGRLF